MVDIRQLANLDPKKLSDSKHQRKAKEALTYMNQVKPVENKNSQF